MSRSSTSDEYECYSFQYENFYTSPAISRANFYPAITEPFVYFAHVPPGQSSNKKGRKSPNCFVKAFRWYTQEHFPQSGYKTGSSRDPNVSGFATWLDTKYEEYLRDSGHCASPYRQQYTVMPTQTSVIDSENVKPCQPCTGPKFKLKSPWRKRRYFNNTNTIDVECRKDGSTNRSLVYLLEPKELTRPASDCCHPTQTPCCSNFEICKSKKSLVKSQSATTFPQEKISAVSKVDQVQVTEGDKTNKNNKPVKKGKKEINKSAAKKAKEPVECQCGKIGPPSPQKLEIMNVGCQCSIVKRNQPVVDKTENIDTECQCKRSEIVKSEDLPTLSTSPTTTKTIETQCQECCGSPTCNRQIICPGCELKVVDIGRCPSLQLTQTATKSTHRKLSIKEEREGYATVVNKTIDSSMVTQQMNDICHCNEKVCCNCTEPQTYFCNGLLYCEANKTSAFATESKEVRLSSKSSLTSLTPVVPRLSLPTNTCTKFLVSDTVQTSDHSICLENTINGYPLFMRIVCADKLNEECACKRKWCL